MVFWSRPADARRARALRSCPAGVVRDYLSAPFPALSSPLAEVELLAIDLETTGLDPAKDRILSIGFVPVTGLSIELAGARSIVVASDAEVGQSATIHRLTDDDIARGVPLPQALAETLGQLSGRVLLAHHDAVETEFLAAACVAQFGAAPVFCSVDTLRLGMEYLERISDEGAGKLRLAALRSRFGLPRYRAHDALTDALAAAELYLALSAELGITRLRQACSR